MREYECLHMNIHTHVHMNVCANTCVYVSMIGHHDERIVLKRTGLKMWPTTAMPKYVHTNLYMSVPSHVCVYTARKQH